MHVLMHVLMYLYVRTWDCTAEVVLLLECNFPPLVSSILLSERSNAAVS